MTLKNSLIFLAGMTLSTAIAIETSFQYPQKIDKVKVFENSNGEKVMRLYKPGTDAYLFQDTDSNNWITQREYEKKIYKNMESLIDLTDETKVTNQLNYRPSIEK
jgi:beta-xylosidase